MVEPTDADREKSVQVRPHYGPCDFPDNTCSCGAAEDRVAIAQALADARDIEVREVRAQALEDAANRSVARVGINPIWLRIEVDKIRKGKL